MWLNEYFVIETRDIIIVKQVWKYIEKVQKSSENVWKSSNVLVICV